MVPVRLVRYAPYTKRCASTATLLHQRNNDKCDYGAYELLFAFVFIYKSKMTCILFDNLFILTLQYIKCNGHLSDETNTLAIQWQTNKWTTENTRIMFRDIEYRCGVVALGLPNMYMSIVPHDHLLVQIEEKNCYYCSDCAFGVFCGQCKSITRNRIDLHSLRTRYTRLPLPLQSACTWHLISCH